MSLDQGLFVPAISGIIEGLTGFIFGLLHRPSAFGGAFPRFSHPNHVFETLIRLRATPATVVVYFGRIMPILRDAR